jgi:hypothetical protein
MTFRLVNRRTIFVLLTSAILGGGCQKNEGTDQTVGATGGTTPISIGGSGGDAAGGGDADGDVVDAPADAVVTPDSGGAIATGGVVGSGGAMGSGGMAMGTGGAIGTGGAPGTGGAVVLPPGPGLAQAIAVTDQWIPSGWYGDAASMAVFMNPALSPIAVIRPATDGPCAPRRQGAVGQCIKFTFKPLAAEIPSSVADGIFLLGFDSMNKPDWTQGIRVPQGANGISALVAGAVGGETVDFTFGHPGNDSFATKLSPLLLRDWQPINISLVGATYDRIVSPFGWASTSRTPITFYIDNVQIK